jgi:hypothetical protein
MVARGVGRRSNTFEPCVRGFAGRLPARLLVRSVRLEAYFTT